MTERRQVILDLITRTGGATAGLEKTTGQIGLLSKSTTNAKAGIGGLTLGATAAAAAAGVLATGVVKSVQAYGEFDDKMTQSLAIMGDVSEMQRKDMSDAAREMAKNSTFSASEAAESYFFLASAGLDAEQSIAALPQVTAFAQAGMFDMATATDLLTDAQSALGLTSDDASENLLGMSRVSDVLVEANKLANASVQQFSEALTNKLGASLRAYGIDVEEGTAALSVFADQGVKGAAAGEALSIVYRDLKRAASENADAFEEAGIAVFDSNGNFRNTADIVEDLTGAFGSLSVQEQTYLANQLGFQDRSFKNIQVLLGQEDALRGYETALRSAGGATEEVANKQLDSFGAQMDLAKSQLTDVAITVGESFAPAILSIVGTLADVVEAAAPFLNVLGDILGFMAKVSPLAIFGKGLSFVRSQFDDTYASAQRVEGVLDDVRARMEKGDDATVVYKEALEELIDNGDLTAESLMEVADATRVSGDDAVRATGKMRDYAEANGASAEAVAALEQKLHDQIDALGLSEEETLALKEKHGLLASEMDQSADAVLRMKAATEGSTDAMDDAGGSADDYGADILSLEDALAAATDAQESLHDATRAFADPVFAAQNAVTDLREAQAKLARLQDEGKEGTDEWTEAMFEAHEATLDWNAASANFSSTNVRDQIQLMADTLGIGFEEAMALFEAMGLLDGLSVQAFANVTFTSGGSTAAMNAISSGAGTFRRGSTTAFSFAEGGRPPVGIASLVGERGPELFVPDRPGTIIPNHHLTSLSGQETRQTTNYYISMEQTGKPEVDAQMVGAVASVLRRMETR